LEKLLIHRIVHHEYTNDLVNQNQLGFTPKKSTTDAAMAVKEFAEEMLRQGLTLSCRTTYICRNAPLTSRCCILYIIQQILVRDILNMLHTLHFSLKNAVYFIMLPFLVPVLFTFYI